MGGGEDGGVGCLSEWWDGVVDGGWWSGLFVWVMG